MQRHPLFLEFLSRASTEYDITKNKQASKNLDAINKQSKTQYQNPDTINKQSKIQIQY